MTTNVRCQEDAQATGSICVYLLVVSLVPLLNKHIMQGLLGAPAFPYPLTLTAVITSVASCLLVLLSAVKHACCDRGSHASWVLGPHLAFKLRAVAPVGLLFGVKGGLSNWGLALADVPTHSLLMATDLVWACLFARIINGERPSGPRLAAVSGVAVGGFLVALGAVAPSQGEVPRMSSFGLLINLLGPAVSGLIISTIRRAAQRVCLDEDSPVRSSVSSLEMAALKMTVAVCLALPLALVLEDAELGAGIPPRLACSLLLAAALVGALHVDVFLMAKLTSALSVGVAGQVKVVPMWLLAVGLGGDFRHSALSMSGAALCLLSSAAWAWHRGGAPLQPDDVRRSPML